MRTTTIAPPMRCGLSLPGHEAHWIQGIHSCDPGEAPPVCCRVHEIRDDGTILVHVRGERVELWTHDPARLRAIVAEHGHAASYQERWRLLRVPHATAAAVRPAPFCIDVARAADPERRPCPSGPWRGTTLADELRATGGFTVPASELLAHLDRRTTGGDG